MPIKTPLTYLRHRRDQAHVRKPTTHAKVASYNYINPQIASPLFSQLPGEIRRLIYEFALTASPDLLRPFSRHSWHYRPGYTHARLINTNLLLTCRRVYLEADHLAISQNEHLIFQPVKHGPPGHSPYLLPMSSSRPSGSKRRGLLKHAQRENIQQVHIFAQQHWLEDWNKEWYNYCNSWNGQNHGIGLDGDEHPERLKITIRHTDWWYFLLGENSPLALDPKFDGRAAPRSWVPDEAPFMQNSWGSRFKLLKGLKVFELELETLEQKKNELDEVVARAFGWRLPLLDDQVLVCDQAATQYLSWTGSKHFKGVYSNGVDPTPGLHLLQGRGISMSMSSSSSATASRPTATRSSSIVSVTKNKEQSARSSWSQPLSRNRNACRAMEEVGDEEELAPGDRLEYYVVTLTFRAQEDTGYVKGRDDDGENENEEEMNTMYTTTAAVAATNTSLPTNVPLVPPIAQQGNHTPPAWVPQRSGFPTAYG